MSRFSASPGRIDAACPGSDSFDIVLNACLDDVRLRNVSLAECLAKYPEHADDLAPLLEVALAIKEIPDVRPSPEFKQATRRNLMRLAAP
jgi:hypothetical protein